MSKDNTGTVSDLVAVTIASVAATAIATMLWYCFDDMLATVTGQPLLGLLEYGQVFAAIFFVTAVARMAQVVRA